MGCDIARVHRCIARSGTDMVLPEGCEDQGEERFCADGKAGLCGRVGEATSSMTPHSFNFSFMIGCICSRSSPVPPSLFSFRTKIKWRDMVPR
jgi:hypothetical protein